MYELINIFQLYIYNFLGTNIVWIILSSLLFFIGLFGVFLGRQSVILIIMCMELMLLAVNFNFICASILFNDNFGTMFSLFILAVGASESAIGLALIVCYYKLFE